jgi:hypothetical protein
VNQGLNSLGRVNVNDEEVAETLDVAPYSTEFGFDFKCIACENQIELTPGHFHDSVEARMKPR